MVQLCPGGTTGERSHRTTADSLRTTLVGNAPRASMVVYASRQRGKRGLDPAPIRPADDAIMHGIGSRCQSHAYSTRTGGDQGRGMRAASRSGPRTARRDVAEARPAARRPVGLRRAIPARGRVTTAAILDGRARFGMSRPGTPQARRLALGRPPWCTIARGLNAFPFPRSEDSSARTQCLVGLRRSRMLSLPSRLGDSPLCPPAAMTSRVSIGDARARCPAARPVRRATGVGLDPAIISAPSRRSTIGRSVRQRR
jgi:hypothetical protein